MRSSFKYIIPVFGLKSNCFSLLIAALHQPDDKIFPLDLVPLEVGFQPLIGFLGHLNGHCPCCSFAKKSQKNFKLSTKKEERLNGLFYHLSALTFEKSACLFPAVSMFLKDEVFSCPELLVRYVFQQLRQVAA